MADQKISQLPETLTPLDNSILAIVDLGQSKKVTYANLVKNLPITTFVEANSAAWGGTLAAARFEINGNVGLFNTLNSTEYIVPWNTIAYQTNTSIIEADNVTNNLIIKQTGVYFLNSLYASYDLIDLNVDYLRMRLRGQIGTPITTTAGGALLYTFDEGFIKTDANGCAASRGSLMLRVDAVPYYLVVTILHSGGAAAGGTAGYPVFENSNGTLPFFTAHKLS